MSTPTSDVYGYIQAGDEIYSIDGHRTYFAGNVSLYLSRNASQVYDVVVVRDGERVKLDDLRIEPYEQRGRNGKSAGCTAMPSR